MTHCVVHIQLHFSVHYLKRNLIVMDKIRSILSSGKKVGPPVPPRPPISAVQKALEKSRNQSQNFSQPTVPIAKGRTVIYTSKINNNNMNGQQHIDHPQQQHQQSGICENKCFDTKLNESSTGLKVIVTTTTATSVANQNGNNTARVHESPIITPANNNRMNNNVLMHHKSPVPRPRLKTPPLLPASNTTTTNTTNQNHQEHQPKSLSPTEHQQQIHINNKQQQNVNYTRLLMQNQNKPSSQHAECIELKQSGKNDQKNNKNHDGNIMSTGMSNRDDELKEKLLNEIFSGRLVEASNVHIRYNVNGSNLKRSSSVDVLNDRNSIIIEKPDEKSKDKKVMFHEMLISELSEMRRAGNDTDNHHHHHHQYHRLSSAKSCSDLSPSGNKQMTIMEMRDDVKLNNNNNSNRNTTCLISLEDSGVEDEEKADDCSSSGVGDSWDSCKDMQNR